MLDIDAMVQAMLASDGEDFGPMAGAYRKIGLRLPLVRLHAREQDCLLESQRGLFCWWHELASDGLPGPDRIEPHALRAHLGNLTLLEPCADGDFVYRLHGSRIVDATGYELTGRKVSQGPRDGSIPDAVLAYFIAGYRIVARRGEPLFARHPWRTKEGQRFEWHRLVLPFGADDTVTRLLVSNLASNDDRHAPAIANDA